MLNTKKGFTLIELLVMVSILAVLATLVVISINKFRNKALDSSVRAQMKTIIDQAGIYAINNNGDYTDMCDLDYGDSIVLAALQQIKFNSDNFNVNGGCETDSQNWVVWVKFNGGGTWCADSSNFSSAETKSLNGNWCE